MKTLWYFTADWCGPCQQFGPLMEMAAQQGIPVKKLNVDYTPDATTTYGIKNVPTIILVEDGQEKARFTGARPLNEIINFYNQ
jgi:thioredoxin 2